MTAKNKKTEEAAPTISLGTVRVCYQLLIQAPAGSGQQAIQIGQALIEMENFIRAYTPTEE